MDSPKGEGDIKTCATFSSNVGVDQKPVFKERINIKVNDLAYVKKLSPKSMDNFCGEKKQDSCAASSKMGPRLLDGKGSCGSQMASKELDTEEPAGFGFFKFFNSSTWNSCSLKRSQCSNLNRPIFNDERKLCECVLQDNPDLPSQRLSTNTLHGVKSVDDMRAWSSSCEDQRRYFLEKMLMTRDDDGDGEGCNENLTGDEKYENLLSKKDEEIERLKKLLRGDAGEGEETSDEPTQKVSSAKSLTEVKFSEDEQPTVEESETEGADEATDTEKLEEEASKKSLVDEATSKVSTEIQDTTSRDSEEKEPSAAGSATQSTTEIEASVKASESIGDVEASKNVSESKTDVEESTKPSESKTDVEASTKASESKANVEASGKTSAVTTGSAEEECEMEAAKEPDDEECELETATEPVDEECELETATEPADEECELETVQEEEEVPGESGDGLTDPSKPVSAVSVFEQSTKQSSASMVKSTSGTAVESEPEKEEVRDEPETDLFEDQPPEETTKIDEVAEDSFKLEESGGTSLSRVELDSFLDGIRPLGSNEELSTELYFIMPDEDAQESVTISTTPTVTTVEAAAASSSASTTVSLPVQVTSSVKPKTAPPPAAVQVSRGPPPNSLRSFSMHDIRVVTCTPCTAPTQTQPSKPQPCQQPQPCQPPPYQPQHDVHAHLFDITAISEQSLGDECLRMIRETFLQSAGDNFATSRELEFSSPHDLLTGLELIQRELALQMAPQMSPTTNNFYCGESYRNASQQPTEPFQQQVQLHNQLQCIQQRLMSLEQQLAEKDQVERNVQAALETTRAQIRNIQVGSECARTMLQNAERTLFQLQANQMHQSNYASSPANYNNPVMNYNAPPLSVPPCFAYNRAQPSQNCCSGRCGGCNRCNQNKRF